MSLDVWFLTPSKCSELRGTDFIKKGEKMQLQLLNVTHYLLNEKLSYPRRLESSTNKKQRQNTVFETLPILMQDFNNHT